jgi:peptide/nickel transport system permease protein
MSPVTTFGLAMPSFYLGSLVIVGYIYYAIWAGPDRQLIEIPVQGFGWDLHLVFPVLVLMGRPVVQIAQVTAELLIAEYDKEYVVAGRAYGHTWRSIRIRYALRNSLVPILANVVNSYRLLLGELILVEYLFAWPGLGRLMASALVPPNIVGVGAQPGLLFMDPILIASLVAIFATFFLVGDLISAIMSRQVDPRLRRLEEEGSTI